MDRQLQIHFQAITCPKEATCFGFFRKPSLGTGLQISAKSSILCRKYYKKTDLSLTDIHMVLFSILAETELNVKIFSYAADNVSN